ncbi:MAG: DUF6033 family protein [Firmicutes bacterium]|nr:DUF6033 family protein [Bacillota bacterium]
MSIGISSQLNYNSFIKSTVNKANNCEKGCKVQTKEVKPSVQDEIRATIPGVNIDAGRMPNGDRDRKAYAFSCAAQGFSRNVTIPQNVLDRMAEDPAFKQKVLRNLKKEFSQIIPDLPGMKVLSHGAVVDEDGNVGGWILGGPDGSQDGIDKGKKSRRQKEEERLEELMFLQEYLDKKRWEEKRQAKYVEEMVYQKKDLAQKAFVQSRMDMGNAVSAYEKNIMIADNIDKR